MQAFQDDSSNGRLPTGDGPLSDLQATENGAGNGAEWTLVWVQERCHKAENEGRCQSLTESVRDQGGGMVCFKKANKFYCWLQRLSRPVYTLVTDWREAKPCIDLMLESGNIAPPVMTIVLCSSQRQVKRVMDWARTVPGRVGTICVHEQSRIPRHLIGGLLRDHFSSDTGAATSLRADLVDATRRETDTAHMSSQEDSTTSVTSDAMHDLEDQADTSASVSEECMLGSGADGSGSTHCPSSGYGVDASQEALPDCGAYEAPAHTGYPLASSLATLLAVHGVPAQEMEPEERKPLKLIRGVDGHLTLMRF